MTETMSEIRSGEVYGLEGQGADFLSQWRQALINMSKALAAQGAMPPHLQTVSVQLRDAADWDQDPVARDLMFREVLGGNIPDFVVSVNREMLAQEALVSVEGFAHLSPTDPEETVYKDFTRAALNREYSARAAVPDHMDIFAEWRSRGEKFRERRTAEIAYGDGPLEKIDIFVPDRHDGVTPPLHVFIHGGYWQAMDKLDHGFLLEALLDSGVAVALPNYGLCPTVPVERIVEQCRDACALLYKQAEKWGYDNQRIHLSGHSAGGHLGGMMAATDWSARASSLPHDLIKSVILISGLFDLEPLRFTGMNRALELTEAGADLNSVVNKSPAYALPVTLAVGGDESAEFHRQSALLARAWEGKADIRWVEMPGRHHFTVVEGLNEPESPLFRAALDAIEAK
ncbi:alpha/beta hydrolase [Aestuariispira ectoiniformans]|uniref:alpha/beta hydrolase n=1 Tax=Aestuariispira ectoiniformans TaxID=2775080 RepID=UPI00223B8158|nr:alpha/beta hydrolase [Aestuariispira ectoiniformans]